MSHRDGAISRGYLLLADLSGYTAYLAESDPEHGPLIAGDFIETVVGRLRGAFRLEKLEGDAALFWADADQVSGSMLVDMVDAAYFAFQRRLRSVSQATTCSCEACSRIPALDLKFVCHLGDALRQRIAGRSELAGRDVIVAHRLLKGTSVERADAHSYLLLTDAAMVALDLDPKALDMIGLTERHEGLGAVQCHLLDLARRWAGEQRRPAGPRPSGSQLSHSERMLPVTPAATWDLLTSPSRRMVWEGIARVDEEIPGRRGVGTVASCVVGRLKTLEEIVDWRPFDAIARRTRHPELGNLTTLYRLTEIASGTHLEASTFAPVSRRATPPAMAYVAEREAALDRLVAAAEAEVAELAAR
jgi:Protein of unknown function (DUF2652)